jgi:hypothetical protein
MISFNIALVEDPPIFSNPENIKTAKTKNAKNIDIKIV